jgi:hypothetical protein
VPCEILSSSLLRPDPAPEYAGAVEKPGGRHNNIHQTNGEAIGNVAGERPRRDRAGRAGSDDFKAWHAIQRRKIRLTTLMTDIINQL